MEDNDQYKKNNLEDQTYTNENMMLIIDDNGLVTSIKHKEDDYGI